MSKKEVWKDIKGYEGIYKISNLGRVKSLRRIIEGRDKSYYNKEIILKNILNGSGYYQVCLYKKSKCKIISIHRLIALHFLDNPNNYNVVNHIDANTMNNELSNLEWCTTKHNFNHAIKIGNLNYDYCRKKVKSVCLKTGKEKIYDFLNQAKTDGFSTSAVSRCANGKIESHKKHRFYFI